MRRKLAGCPLLVALLTTAAAAQPTIYGSAYNGPQGPAGLYTLSPVTGAATFIGLIGFNRVGTLAFSPDGTLYGTGTDGTHWYLLTINTSTGGGTIAATLSIPGPYFDMAFRPSDGTLFAYSCHLFTINTSSGTATNLGGDNCGNGEALAFSPSDSLYYADNTNLELINQSTGLGTFVAPLTYAPEFGTLQSRADAMKFDPETGTLWASVVNNNPTVPLESVGTYSLGIINITTGAVTVVGTTVSGLAAIAVAPAAATVPASSK
jgi:sugar lactone lactonase YvrE